MTFSLQRAGKWVTVVTLLAAMLTLAARVGISRYLSSSRGKVMVSDRLGSALGMPVEVSELDVSDDSALFRFRVMDPADPKSEVFTVKSASADVSVADLVTGRVTPSAVNLNGAALTLRVGPDGQMLTTLPALYASSTSFPEVAINDASVCVRREGRADFAVSGITVRLAPSGGMLVLSGSVNDPRWGMWTIRGELRRGYTRAGWIELTSSDAPLDTETLETLPFAPAGFSERLKSTGRGSVTVRLTINHDRTVHPFVEVRPLDAELELPDLELTLTAVTGLLRLSGSDVEIVGLKGNVAGGSITVDGTCPLASESTAELNVTARGLDTKELPASWELPANVPGKLDGQATLNLSIDRDGRIAPYGNGSVTLSDHKLLGAPVGTPFRLYGDGTHFRFEPVR
ncbi:MAG: hypothetical protein L0241_11770 [Planctomycetia bacterium]|nr:hypothetical protein [Planctomycetia bacterium]